LKKVYEGETDYKKLLIMTSGKIFLVSELKNFRVKKKNRKWICWFVSCWTAFYCC